MEFQKRYLTMPQMFVTSDNGWTTLDSNRINLSVPVAIEWIGRKDGVNSNENGLEIGLQRNEKIETFHSRLLLNYTRIPHA